jgi:hypothetical protein
MDACTDLEIDVLNLVAFSNCIFELLSDLRVCFDQFTFRNVLLGVF